MNLKKLNRLFVVVFGFLFMVSFSLPAQALTYSQIANPGKVLGDTTNSFNPYPTGTLVNDSGTVYFISGTTKVPFTNWQAFIGLGYKAKNIVDGDLTNYTLASNYTINSANTAHPWGSYLIYKGTVYYSTQAGLIGVPSVQVFTSNGGDWTYIVKANSYDAAVLNANPNLPILTLNDPRVYGNTTYQNLLPTPTPTSTIYPTPTVIQPTQAPIITPAPFPTSSNPYSPVITNVSPSGSSITLGNNIQVSWNSSGLPADAKVYVKLLSSDGIFSYGNLVNSQQGCASSSNSVSGSSYQWNYSPSSDPRYAYLLCGLEQPLGPIQPMSSNGVRTGTYLINVEAYSGNTLIARAQSNQPFSIVDSGPSSTNGVVSQNPNYSVQSYAPGTTQAKIASFVINNPAGQSIKLLGVLLSTPLTTSPTQGSLTLNNIVAKFNEDIIPNGVPSTSSLSNNDGTHLQYQFVVNLTIPAGGNSTVNIYADIPANTNSGTYISPISVVSTNAIFTDYNFHNDNFNSNIVGQNLIITGSNSGNIINPPATQSSFSTSLNSSLGSVTVAAGSTNTKIGSYIITNPKTEDISISGLSFTIGSGYANPNIVLNNLTFMKNSSMIDRSLISITGSATQNLNSGNQTLIVPAGGTAVIDVYADVASGTVMNPATTLTYCYGKGVVSQATFVCGGVPVSGQSLSVSN